jgi:hypothetical protein
MSSKSSSSSAYSERLNNAFDGFGCAGFEAASILLFRRSAWGSRAGNTEDTGFGIVGEGNKGPMNGWLRFSPAPTTVSGILFFLNVFLTPWGETGGC